LDYRNRFEQTGDVKKLIKKYSKKFFRCEENKEK
jgi:hypothetical protein